MEWTPFELQRSFRGAVDDQGNPSYRYIPEIMIERVWDLPEMFQAEFSNQNYVSGISIDLRKFGDVDAVFEAIVIGIQGDLRDMLRDFEDVDCPFIPPFQVASALNYKIWISNDNMDPQEQPRIHATEIEDLQLCMINGVEGSFQITDGDKVQMMKLIGMCAPWFDKSKSPQQELFLA